MARPCGLIDARDWASYVAPERETVALTMPRRGKALQPPPSGARPRRIRPADGEPQPAQPEDDGRGGARKHPSGPASGGGRAPRLGLVRRRGEGAGRPSRRRADRPAREGRTRARRRHSGLAAAPYAELMDNIDEGGLIHGLAGSGKTIVFSRRSSSIALSASVPPWRCRPPRTKG